MPENQDNQDYDYVIGKLPRKDKDGRDTTKDKMGKGGRHREDGTFSSMPYDLEVLDSDPTKLAQESTPIITPPRERRPVRYEDLSPLEQILVDGLQKLVDGLSEYATYKITEGIENWFEKKRRKKQQERMTQKKKATAATAIKKKPQSQSAQTVAKAQKPIEKKSTTSVIIPDEFTRAFEQYSVNMTSEEAQKELLDAFILYVISAKKVWKVAHANITDSNGKQINGNDMLDALSSSSIIDSINSIIAHNPALLEEWQSMALEGVLGHDIITEGRYVPIEISDLRKALTDKTE